MSQGRPRLAPRSGRPWTEEELAVVRAGGSTKTVARQLGRTRQAVEAVRTVERARAGLAKR